ncbi:hypothetical protein ABIC09_001281 [Bradyrhizobium sp. S3.12.5]
MTYVLIVVSWLGVANGAVISKNFRAQNVAKQPAWH